MLRIDPSGAIAEDEIIANESDRLERRDKPVPSGEEQSAGAGNNHHPKRITNPLFFFMFKKSFSLKRNYLTRLSPLLQEETSQDLLENQAAVMLTVIPLELIPEKAI
jgi:hypothetical protein